MACGAICRRGCRAPGLPNCLTFPLLTVCAQPDPLLVNNQLPGAVRLQHDQQYHADVPQDYGVVGRAGRFTAVLVVVDGSVCLGGYAAQMVAGQRIPALGDRGYTGDPGILPDPGAVRREPICTLLADAGWAADDGSVPARRQHSAHTHDGRGLNPLLRHLGMIIHPPLLYLGFVSFVIPFAFAIAAMITGRSDDRWIRVTPALDAGGVALSCRWVGAGQPLGL
jgi:hypothetical protein